MADWKYLGIGFGIGVAAALSISLATLQGTTNRGLLDPINCQRPECFDFMFLGFTKEISADSLSLTQTLDQTTGIENSEPIVIFAVDQGSPFMWCTQEKCERITYDKIPVGSPVCAHARLNPDGTFTVDRFFFNSVCNWQSPPDSDKDGLTDACELNMTKTNFVNPDSDGDGLKDGEEDSDLDGLTNSEECTGGTDPLDPDST